MPVAAILAGGVAKRLYPDTEKIPKSLIEVGGFPFIFHQLALLKREEITGIVLCAGKFGEQIREVVGDGAEFGISVEYSFDGDTLLGTGGAIRKALPILGDLFWVFYGDSYLDTRYPPILEAFTAQEKPGLMTVYENRGRWDTSNVVFRDGKLLNYDKQNLTPDMHHLDYGISLFRKEVFSGYPESEYLDLADVHSRLLKNKKLMGFEVYNRFYEIGSPKGQKEFDDYVGNNGSAYTNNRMGQA